MCGDFVEFRITLSGIISRFHEYRQENAMYRLCLCLLVMVACGQAASSSFGADSPKLNVLLLMSDDLRPDLGCYGHPLVKSPNTDALAAAGVRFERAYCQYPLCNPSRSSMLTGRHPLTTGVLDNRLWFGVAHPEFVSLPKHFKRHGYQTLRAGKIFHGGIDDSEAWSAGGEARTFTGAVSNRQQPANRVQQSDRRVILPGDGESHGDFKAADKAIAYLREHQNKPFFLACGFTKPHSPPTAPQRFFDLYDPAKILLSVDFQPAPASPPGFPKASVTRNGDLFIDREASADGAREMIQAYWASSSWMDWNLGRVIAELDRLQLREKTVIVFLGDHGYHLGEKGKWSKHGSLFEVGTRVPLIVAAPGMKGNGKSSPRVVQALDIYPTLCELCGIPPADDLQGHSLTPLLNAPASSWDHPAFSVVGSNNRLSGVSIRTERYRYAEYDGGQGGAMLFDEQNDPHELKNLADVPEMSTLKQELSNRIEHFITTTRAAAGK
jgi:iduronate 2-sulfatase